MTEITEMPVRSRWAAWEPVIAWLLTLGRLVLGGVWIADGIAKVTDLDASVRAVRAYRLLPEIAAQITGAGLPVVEILLGVLLVVGTGIRASAVVSSILMVAFVVGIASAWARGSGSTAAASARAVSSPQARTRPTRGSSRATGGSC